MGNLKCSLAFPSPLASLSNQTPNSALLIPVSELNLSPSCHAHCHNIISLQVCIIQFLTLPSPAPTSEAGGYCLKCNLKKKKKVIISFKELLIKKNGILPSATTLMGPESKMLSEISQTETFCFTYMWNLKNKTNECI